MNIQINPIPAFDDNYIWIVHDDEHALIVDPGSAKLVEEYLAKHQLKLTTIIITHHHWDHINGVESLEKNWGCEVFGPQDERIPFIKKVVKEGDRVSDLKLGIHLNVIETPGHTLSHICYHNEDILFCGDTLFSIGCGKMFEGTADQFVTSLNKIKRLKNDTVVYCTHEYTKNNIEFALSIDPNNAILLSKKTEVAELRTINKPTIPVTLVDECKLNPFLKTNDTQFQKVLSQRFNTEFSNEIECFAYLRAAKDDF